MASVQELLLALEAQKSPFMSLMEGAAQGFGQAQSGALERTKTLMAMDQARREREQQESNNREIQQKIAVATEQRTTQAHKALSGPGTSPAPGPRLKESYSRDASGNYQTKIEVVEPKEISYQKADYLDASGKVRVGRFNPTTGDIEQRPNDPFAPKSAAEAQASAGKIIPASSVITLTEGQSVANILPDVERAIINNEAIFGPVTGRFGSANPYNTQAQTVDSEMRTASQTFGRFMEGGVLRKEDEIKYERMFPQTKDTPQVAKNKLAIVRRKLAQKYEDTRKTLGGSGYDVSGFSELQIPASLFDGANSASGNQADSAEEIALTGSEAVELIALRKRFGKGKK